MSAIYDNWERLVDAVLKKEELWQLFHQQSRTPSICSQASSFDLRSPPNGLFDFSMPEASSSFRQFLEDAATKLQLLPPRLVFVSDCDYSFDIDDVLGASTELLGQGTFGDAFKLILDDDLILVLKRLKLLSISGQDFERQMEILGNIKHENVAPLIAYYSDKYGTLVLYEHYKSGSVSELLHGKRKDEKWANVDWETRLRIAVGAARGISQIHSQNDGKLVHGNVKATNVFLNSQGYGCISDLGLTNIISTTFMRTARCYAPEVKNTQKVSQASDVYSYGVLLLQLLTRKSPTHVANGPEAVDLVKLVNSVKSKVWFDKVFDTELSRILSINNQMISMLQVGISCVAKSPKKRPKMSEVVKMIENIVSMKIENDASPSSRMSLVFLDAGVPLYDLEDLLSASAEVLGKGPHGTSYKAVLENGNTVRVKRLRNVSVTQKEFEQHMEVIGRIKHENVSELRAYYYSKDEKLLVYDYCNQSCLSVTLHGNIIYREAPFNWARRLNIALGAAKGIAHIHSQDGAKLVHGNINSSNIFPTEQQHARIFDVGLAKVATSDLYMRTKGYHAPEVLDSLRMTQASDVYSFGIVLLELLTRKQPKVTVDGNDMSLIQWVQSNILDEWTAEIFDAELLRNDSHEEEAMVKVLQTALSCVSSKPWQRPKIAEVVEMLNDVSASGDG